MERATDGRIRSSLAFQDAPWRDGEEFVSTNPLDVGDRIEVSARDVPSETWEVGDRWNAPEGGPETLLLFRP
jgi:hypothetical protein